MGRKGNKQSDRDQTKLQTQENKHSPILDVQNLGQVKKSWNIILTTVTLYMLSLDWPSQAVPSCRRGVSQPLVYSLALLDISVSY